MTAKHSVDGGAFLGPAFSLLGTWDKVRMMAGEKTMSSLTKKKSDPARGISRKTPSSSVTTGGPIASRPIMPAQYGASRSEKGILEWSWARERLSDSHNYVIVTVRPDGRPHAMGMHGLWFDDAFYFGTGKTTRKARNLAGNANCIVINERLDELVIVEGRAERISYSDLPQGLSPLSKKKYGWPMDPRMGGIVFKLIPRTVFGFPLKQFATAMTRWKFS